MSGPPEHTEPPSRPSEIGIAISEQELEGFQHRSSIPSAQPSESSITHPSKLLSIRAVPRLSSGSKQAIGDKVGIDQKGLKSDAWCQILTLKSANVVQSRKFSEMLENTLKRYRDGDLEDIQNVIDELLELGSQMKAANDRGENLGLTYEELAFYDSLEDNEVAVRKMGESKLCEIAKAMAERVKELWTVDWVFSERKQAQFRIMLRDLLDEYGYPPEVCEKAVETVLEQAKLNATNCCN